MKEDYTLEMSEKRATIHGEVTLSHLFELLNFLDLQGFDEVEIDEYDGKMKFFKDRQLARDTVKKENEEFFESQYHLAKKENEALEKEIHEIEAKANALMKILREKDQELTHQQKELLEQQKIYNRQKEHIIKKVLENPDAQQIMDGINA